MNKELFYVEIGQERLGPLLACEILQLRAEGVLSGDETIRQIDGDERPWDHLREAFLPESSPPPYPCASRLCVIPAYNPYWVIWLGVLFTPIWVGAMAAWNARKLNTSAGLWLPLVIGAAWLVADVAVALSPLNGLVAHGILIAIALGLCWRCGLASQGHALRAPIHHWVLPFALGTGGAAYVATQFIAVPFRPMPPHRFCEQVVLANTEERARSIAEELKPALAIIHWLAENGRETYALQPGYVIRDTDVAPHLLVKCCVDFSFQWRDRSGERFCAGYFTLLPAGRTWRISDMYLTQIDDQQSHGSITKDTDVLWQLLRGEGEEEANEHWTARQPGDALHLRVQRTDSENKPNGWARYSALLAWGTRATWALLASGGGKKIVVAMVVLFFGKAGFDHWRRQSQEKASETPPES